MASCAYAAGDASCTVLRSKLRWYGCDIHCAFEKMEGADSNGVVELSWHAYKPQDEFYYNLFDDVRDGYLLLQVSERQPPARKRLSLSGPMAIS